MKLCDLLGNVEIIGYNADLNMEIEGISYDSRKTKQGDMFVAIKGLSTDGHQFIRKAAEKGASCVLCQDIPDFDFPYVQVKNSRYAMAITSRDFYGDPASKMKLIGFTGTSGKTTSTTLLKHLLEEKAGAKVGLIGTNGNMIGDELIHTEFTTPESLELHGLFKKMLDAGCTHVVMEVSSHSLALDRVAGLSFDVAVFTNLSQDHLDLHGTMDEYAAAKRKIFSQCKEGWVNADDDRAAFMAEGAKCRIMRYSAKSNYAELIAKDIRLSPAGVRFASVYGNDIAMIKLNIPGVFSVYNALSVTAAGLSLGISLGDCADALLSAEGVKGRMESVPTDGDYSVIIDYSHKPDALDKALKTLKPITRGKLVVLFGCGGDRDRAKRPIMGRIAGDNSDFVIVTSDNPRTEDAMSIIREIVPGVKKSRTPYKVICDRRAAIAWAIDNLTQGDVLLLAGKGHEDYQIIGHEKHHMDEREIVADVLEKRKTGR